MHSPIPLQEAWRRIEQQSHALPPQPYPLLEAVGLILAETTVADVDMPPFDKSAVDGVALRSADALVGSQLQIVDELHAGSVPRRAVHAGEAIQIMTGAPLPPGADAVVRVEEVGERSLQDGCVRVEITHSVAPGQNVCRQGQDIAAGRELLPRGTRIQPHHVGLLAGQGWVRVVGHRRPRVAVLATGTELVAPNERPGLGQIRNSNSISLVSAVLSSGALGHDLGITSDDEASLLEALQRALTQDVVLLSGGVSAGVRDLVPWALAEVGVKTIFHHVAIQPGRPVLYGVKGNQQVFGLPGNPVSAFVGFELFVRPLLRRLMGIEPAFPERRLAHWKGPPLTAADRTRLIGVRLHRESIDRFTACPVESRGSADLMGLARSEALAVVQPDERLQSGDTVEIVRLEDD